MPDTDPYGTGFSGSDDRRWFSFNIWNRDEACCCPTAGMVKGTYKITKSESFDPGKNRWIASYDMSVAAAIREFVKQEP